MDDETQEAIGQINLRLDHIEQHLVQLSQSGWQTRYVPMGRRMPDRSGVPAEVLELARSGDRLGAITLYRKLTGASATEAADAIDGLAAS